MLLATGLGSHNQANAQAKVVAFGDSYVDPGAGGRHLGMRPWVSSLGEPVRNLGHPGDGVADTLARVRHAGGVTFDVAVIEVGINDVRRAGTDPLLMARFRDDYDKVLQRLSSARLVVVVPPLPVISWGSQGSEAALLAHRTVVLELAAHYPNVQVADPLPWWHPETMLMSDGLHPDAQGRVVIADAVRAALAGTT